MLFIQRMILSLYTSCKYIPHYLYGILQIYLRAWGFQIPHHDGLKWELNKRHMKTVGRLENNSAVGISEPGCWTIWMCFNNRVLLSLGDIIPNKWNKNYVRKLYCLYTTYWNEEYLGMSLLALIVLRVGMYLRDVYFF